MLYVESDFLIALIKEKDWLKDKASRAYEKYRRNLWTSGYTIIEILLLSEELGLDQEKLVVNIYRILEVRNLEETTAILIAHRMKKDKLSTFDAIHSVFSDPDPILSSDHIYDKIGLDRIKLELE